MNKINLYKYFLLLIPVFLVAQEVEEVIVTANKKAETVQEIPMNISVISEAALEERGIMNPEDYLRSIAGVSTPGGSNYYTFRGLNTSTSQRSSGTSSTYIDEVSGSLMGLFDVERVEVLRGPQGTLYGSNAIGGTIRYITNKPDSSASYGKIRVGYGNKVKADDPETSIEMMYNLPLSDSLAVRAVYSQLISPGIYKNIQTGNTVGEEDDSHFKTMEVLLNHIDFTSLHKLIDQGDENGRTAIMYAVMQDHDDVIQPLLEHGADLSRIDNDGWHVVLYGALYNRFQLLNKFFSNDDYDLNHELVNVPGNMGYSPLVIAAEQGWENTVRILLSYGANPTFLCRDKKYPYEHAKDKGHNEIAVLLKEKYDEFNARKDDL